jgi:hypothetical protein
MAVWDGFDTANGMVDAGIPDPGDWSTNVGSTTMGKDLGLSPGVHTARYRYINSKTQYPSNPCNPDSTPSSRPRSV